MKLTVLGTGNAIATQCYNTCFAVQDHGQTLLVDAGGGNEILKRLPAAGIAVNDLHTMFVTHKHIDHLLGVIWIVRVVTMNMLKGTYDGDFTIYSHDEVIDLITYMSTHLLTGKQAALIGDRLHLIPLKDGESFYGAGHKITVFDIHSTKAKQFGFVMDLGGGRHLICCGDEPCPKSAEKLAAGSEWMLHEAFCRYSDRETYKPYEKHHSTVKDACELAERLKVPNLILYHTEDHHITDRKALYGAEGRQYYSGRLEIPDDLEGFYILSD
jgi:ribonuclease Z